MQILERDEGWTAFDIEFNCGCKARAAGPYHMPADFFRIWERGCAQSESWHCRLFIDKYNSGTAGKGNQSG